MVLWAVLAPVCSLRGAGEVVEATLWLVTGMQMILLAYFAIPWGLMPVESVDDFLWLVVRVSTF